MENTSGTGKDAVVPPEIDRWNWESFSYGYLWAAKYNLPREITYKIIFISLINPFYPFILARRGNAILWKYKKWESVEHFLAHQAGEDRAGRALFCLNLFFFAFAALVILAIFLYETFS